MATFTFRKKKRKRKRKILIVHLPAPTFLRLRLLRLRPSVLHPLPVPGLQRWLLSGLRARVRIIRPVLGGGGAGLLLAPMLAQGVVLLAGEEVVGLVLHGLRGTPVHRPQRGGCDLGRDGQLDRQGVHLLLALVTVTGGELRHQTNQEEGNEAAEGGQSCDRRDGAGGEVEGKSMRGGGVTEKLSEKMYCLLAPRATPSAQTLIPMPAITQNDISCILHATHPSFTSDTIHLTISPSLRCVH